MRIQMKRTEIVAMDGVDFGRLRAGMVYDLPSAVASVLVSSGVATALLSDEGREEEPPPRRSNLTDKIWCLGLSPGLA